MPEIQFPASTAPSRNPTENGGRVINAYSEIAPAGSRSKYLFRRAPGLEAAFVAGSDVPRGALMVGSVLYVVNGEKAYTITKAGVNYTVSELSGSVSGEGPVMIVHNMRAPTPQILINTSDAVDQIVSGAVSTFSDPDLPTINSLSFMDGYFVGTSANGRAYSSDLNDDEFDENNYATAEAATDGLVRGVAAGRDLLLMGESTTEFWGNAGNPEGFPFSRGPVIQIGLLSPYAVAGFEPGFPAQPCWVGSDCVIYRLEGYSPQPISTPHLQRLVEMANPADLRACVFVISGHPFWAISSSDWTFVHDLSTGEWHERMSYGETRWRAAFTIKAFDEWLAFDRDTAQVFRIKPTVRREGDNPLIFELRSTQAHRFPGRVNVPRVSFDFVVGVGSDTGIFPIETNPKASISWSDDGGRTFGNELLRDLGTQGQQTRIDVHRTGLTSRSGRQWRVRVSDPVECVLLGASMDVEERAP